MGQNKLKVFSFFPGDMENERLDGTNYFDSSFNFSEYVLWLLLKAGCCLTALPLLPP